MSTPSAHSRQASAGQRQRQRGVYALEWAIIFSAFFMLLYAIVSFGLGFLVRESMQWAVEDGARAALQYQADRTARKNKTKEVIATNLSWLPAELRTALSQGNNFRFQICRLNDSTSCTEDMTPSAMPCDAQAGQSCLVQVSISLPYAKHAFTPSLTMGLMELAMPNLQAQSQIQVGPGGF